MKIAIAYQAVNQHINKQGGGKMWFLEKKKLYLCQTMAPEK